MSEETPNQSIEPKAAAGALAMPDYGAYAGAGSTNLPKSGRINYLSIVQSNSKALKRNHEKYNPNAAIGSFLLGKEVIDGEKGVYFIGIEKQHVLVEMTKTDGTGEKVGEHDPHGPVAKAARAKYGPDKYKWKSEKGNFLIDSIRLYCVLFDTEEDIKNLNPRCSAILDFQKTKMAAWETYTAPLNCIKDGDPRPPLFAIMGHISTAMESRKGHDYYNYRIRFVGGDFLKSLVLPTNPKWKEWAEECMKVSAGVNSGALQGETTDTDEDGEDIPF